MLNEIIAIIIKYDIVPYKLAVFLIKYDIILIGILLGVYTILASHLAYLVDKKNLMDIPSMHSNLLENLGLLKRLIREQYITISVTTFIIVLIGKYIGYKDVYNLAGVLIFYSGVLYPAFLSSNRRIVNKTTSDMYENLPGME